MMYLMDCSILPYMYMYLCVSVCMCAFVCVCVFMCVCVHVFVCLSVCCVRVLAV